MKMELLAAIGLWYLFDDDDNNRYYKQHKIEPLITDNVTFKVRSQIIELTITEKKSKIKIKGRHRNFWFIGKTRTKVGDFVEIHYQIIGNRNYTSAWISKIIKIIPATSTLLIES